MAKYLDKAGLDLLVNNYLKPETEYSLTSIHPIQNKVLTQTLGNLLSIIDYSKSTGYFHYADMASLPAVNSTRRDEGDFEYNPEKEMKVGQRAILDDTQAIMEITAIDSETGSLTWTDTGLSFAGQVIQVIALPTASESEESRIYQYVGATTDTLTNGFFYKCVSDGETPASYEWINIPVSEPVVDSELSDSSTNPVQNKVVTESLNDKYPKEWDVELTQAEYDALPNTKYVDGKNYYITDGDPDKPIIYGFHVDPDESDPSDAVTYLMDAVGMEPAKMGTAAFNYGSWKNAFFMPKPCMLKYDGTVDYYLDPNDFTKKADGTASDVGNINYEGNAMMEFPKIWFKFEAGTADGEGYFYVSNQKVDDTYMCWCNMDADGNEINHFYMAIYNGTMPNGLSDKMRSLSGLRLTPTIDGFAAYNNTKTYAVGALCKVDSTAYQCITAVTTAEEFDAEKWQEITPNNAGYTTGQQEVDAAVANDTTAKSEWYIDTWCDRVLITALLYLMGKSLDLQATFGRGIDSGTQLVAEAYVTGAANDKGLFYGSTSNGSAVVKVFGIENFWACKWHRTAGLIGNSSGGYSYKMTASTADGSNVNGYNSNGNGYLTTTFNRPTSKYVRLMEFGAHGTLPLNTTNATSSTYYCDYFYSGTGFALVGGHSYNGAYCGFYVDLRYAFGYRIWYVAAALSCKPLANKEV